jgi:hypothetical protein
MIAYEVTGQNAAGEFIVGYRTPGAPDVITVAGTASSKRGAEIECERLNAMSRKADLAIQADMAARWVLSLDKEN